MTDLELSEHFEAWHSQSRQYKKYGMNHRKQISVTGHIDYCDYRVNWAWIAFKGSYKYFATMRE